MASYLSALRIQKAIKQLGESRAKRTPLFDFLIVKRTLVLKGSTSAPIAESEPLFIKALDEIGAANLGDQDHYYFNPFALLEAGKTGYRPIRYRSNGTNSTISGTPWRQVIDLSNEKPRKASLTAGHEAHLATLALTTDKRKPLPNLTEAAIWFWRGQDLDTLLSGATTDSDKLKRLRDEFVKATGLAPGEIIAVFEDTIDASGTSDGGPFSPTAPDPLNYLPIKALPVGETKEENLSEV